jgi:hypothetical protein
LIARHRDDVAHTLGIKGSSIHTQFLREMAETAGLLLKFSIPQRRDVQRGQVWLALLGRVTT